MEGSLRRLGPPRRRRRLRAFDSPAAFSRSCLRLAAGIGVVGVVGLVDRLFALSLVVLLCLFAGLARLVALDHEDDAPEGPVPPELRRPDAVATPAAASGSVVVRRSVPRTFRLPSSVGADRVHLVGDFNGWSPTATPMCREGAWFRAEVELEPGASYRYRYLLDGERWENDWAADAYVPNAFGSDDSVARTSPVSSPSSRGGARPAR